MSDLTDSTMSLVGHLVSAGESRATGTLRVLGGEGQVKQIFLQDGSIADIDTGREDTLLEAALRDTGSFSDKDMKQAQRKAQKAGTSVGAALLELGQVPEETIDEGIRARITEEICELATWPLSAVDFFEHQADERLESFFSELTEFYEVSVDPEKVVIELARRLRREDLLEKTFPILKDVFYATPASFHYFREPGQFPAEYGVLSKVDGTKDVSEVIAESGVDPFTGLELFRRLQTGGELELINPVQLYQLGVDYASAGNFAKACKLFQRAHQRGLDDFDVQLKLAQAMEALGRIPEAVERYLEFADKCLNQLRVDDAIRSLHRVTLLDPARLQIHERYIKLVAEQGREGEAVEHGISVAQSLVERKDLRGGLDLLLKLRSLSPKDIRLQQKIIEIAEACHDFQAARAERELLAKNCDEKKDIETALETYQRMFCEGNDSLEVRLKLVELHRLRGNRAKALEHISSILNLPEKRRPHDERTLLELHQGLVELRPNDLRSNRWLADYYTKKGDNAKGAAVLSAWIGALEREGDLHELVHVYERLILVDDRNEHRWGLAQVLEKLGRPAEALRQLRSMANLALRKKDLDQASKALDQALKSFPLDLETRKLQAELCEAQAGGEMTLRKHEEIALLCILAGNVHDAELYCRRLDPAKPGTPDILRKLGLLCLEQGDQHKGVEQLHKAAKSHFELKNFGLCRLTLEELLRADPGHTEGKSLLAELASGESAPMTRGSGPVPAHPSQATTLTAVAPAPPAPAPAAEREVRATQPSAEPTNSTGGIFEPSPTIRTTVSTITARLKKLKTVGTSAGRMGPVSTPEASSQAAEPSKARSPEGDSRQECAGASVVTSSTALRSAASRLKALAHRKAEEAGKQASPDPAVQPSGEPNHAGQSLQAAEPAAPVPQAAAPAAETAPPAPATAEEGGQAQPAAIRKLKLASSASRLAALRSKATTTA